MKHPAISVLVFGLYMAAEGIILLLAPNFLLSLFGIPAALDVWVRVVGIALVIFAYYYIRSAFSNNLEFFRFTTQGRTLQLILFVVLVFGFEAPPILLLFAGTEFLSGVWTWIALRGEAA